MLCLCTFCNPLARWCILCAGPRRPGSLYTVQTYVAGSQQSMMVVRGEAEHFFARTTGSNSFQVIIPPSVLHPRPDHREERELLGAGGLSSCLFCFCTGCAG